MGVRRGFDEIDTVVVVAAAVVDVGGGGDAAAVEGAAAAANLDESGEAAFSFDKAIQFHDTLAQEAVALNRSLV